jgi:1,5-anhydro-D-fructose reductase (1,5-anhydro-D-mannitol-forming)
VPDPITVAVLGFWHVHAAEYAAQAHQHPDTKLVAVWDDDPVRGRAAADAVDAVFVGDLDNLLGRADIDAVTVTTATSAHRAIILSAAQAGKHIFTEKLLAPTVTEAEEILGLSDEAHVALEVSLPRLYHGYARAILEELDRGTLGELTYCGIRLSHDGAIAGWLPERFYDPADAVGGALSDLGCHPVYLTQLFLGARPAEDQAVVTLGYPGGAIDVIETGFLSRDPFTIKMRGTKASLVYEGMQNLLRVRSAGADTWQPLPIPHDDADPFSQWVSHIRAATRADDNLSRAVELTRLVSAANAAAAAHTTVRYPIGAA